MNTRFFSLLLGLGIFVGQIGSSLAQAQEQALQKRSVHELREAAVEQIEVMHELFLSDYAPAELKKKLFGWDPDREARVAKETIARMTSRDLRDYQRVLRDYAQSARDYHVSVTFSTTERATLPVRIRGAQGRFFFSEIDRNALPESQFPVQEGDELVTFGGMDTAAAISHVRKELGISVYAPADEAYAERFLTDRRSSLFMQVPRGKIELGVLRKGETGIQSFPLSWDYTPENVPHVFPSSQAPNGLRRDGALSADRTKRGVLPELGDVLWQAPADNTFRASIFALDSKRIGYVRIADFDGDDTRVKDFAGLIAKMESETDALVLDQLDNPGGQSYYLDALVSLLVTQPVPTAMFRMAVSTSQLASSERELQAIEGAHTLEDLQKVLGTSLAGYPVDLPFGESLKMYDRYLVDEWKAGRKVTEPHYRRVRAIAPKNGATTYSKPILVLVNEADYSCADMFPALLQDLGRATIFGSRTAGAGGNNNTPWATPNDLEVESYSITETSELRPDGSYLENHGVEPDVPYEVTASDLQSGYAEFIQAVRDTLQDMLSGKSSGR